jgi:cell division protein FtsL
VEVGGVNPFAIFTQRVRGVRVLDLMAAAVLLVLALGSYAFKTMAEAQGAGAADIQAQINQEERRIRLLKAEISHLEAPSRIEALSTQYLQMGAPDAKHEIGLADLPRIAAAEAPAPLPAKAPTP